MKIISLYNMKGGVGKTTICVNLAYHAADEGFRTLLVDLDPQGAASFYFRVRSAKKFNSRSFLRGGKKLFQSIKASDYENLDIIPASISFRNLDLKLDSGKKNINRLKKILSKFKNEYDIIFIDSPPNLTLLSENILEASNAIILPVIPTPLSIEAYKKLQKFLIKKKIETSSFFLLLSMVEERKSLQKEIIESLNSKEIKLLKTKIPYKVEIEKMGLRREPLPAYSKSTSAAKSFSSLWAEFKENIDFKTRDVKR